jgi:hypothetical protein
MFDLGEEKETHFITMEYVPGLHSEAIFHQV